MAEPDRPQSPFAGMADLSARTPVLSPVEIERMLAEHRLYLESEYHQGHPANFSSADLPGEISRASICVESRWTWPFSSAQISAVPVYKERISSAPLQSGRASNRAKSIQVAFKRGESRFGQPRGRVSNQGGYGVRADGQRDAAGRQPA